MTKKELQKINPMAIAGLIKQNEKLPLRIVWNAVCIHFQISEEKLRSKNQKREIITPRHIYYYLAKKYTTSTNAYIGEFGSNEDWKAGHSNVHLMGNKVGLMLSTDHEYRTAVKEIEKSLLKTIKS